MFNSDDAVEVRGKGKNVILVRKKTAPDDIHGMTASDAILAHTAGKTSHVAVVSRTLGKPVVVGKEIRIDEERKQFKVVDTDIVVRKGTIISVDGYTGNVYLGEIKTVKVDTGIRDTRDTDKSL